MSQNGDHDATTGILGPKPRPHTCAMGACEILLPRTVLMCGPHWRLLPAKLKHEVYAVWRRYCREGTVEAARAHNEMKVRCVEAVEEKLAAKGRRL